MLRSCLYLLCSWWLTWPSANAQTTPKKLLIFYGYPSGFNYPTNGYSLNSVATDMARYDYVVLGSGLEKSGHPDHSFTQDLVTSPATGAVRFFGYIDLGIRTPGGSPLSNHSPAELETRIREWKATGIDGIFFDDVEYDYGVSRSRMNAAVHYVHEQGLSVAVNGNRPDEIFGSQINPTYNPTGVSTAIDSRDAYLSESFLVSEGSYADPLFWQPKAALVENYRQQFGFRIWSITTNSFAQANASDAGLLPLFHYAWYGAWLYGHEATGWGEYGFSAGDPNNSLSPFRTRPNPASPGAAAGPVRQSGSLLARYTSTGWIQLDTQAHAGNFTPCGTCQSTGSGAWHTAGLWTCGRIPLACDAVEILPSHVITLTDSADAGYLLLRGKLRPTTYRLRFRAY